jgi:hypothetical protein
MKRAIFASLSAFAAASALVVAGAGAANAAASTIYDSTTTEHALPSQPFQAQQTSEFGDEVLFTGTARSLVTVTATMETFACQAGAWNTGDCLSDATARVSVPITLNVYNPSVTNLDGSVTPGSLITSATNNFALPYRPSANSKKCKGVDAGKWYDGASGSCYNSKAINVVFNLKSLKVKVPSGAVLGLAFNTTNYGYNPIGHQACNDTTAGCYYDSLNVALKDSGAPTAGAQKTPGTAFINTATAGVLCDGGAVAHTGVFNQDSPDNHCWTGYVPAFKVVAK